MTRGVDAKVYEDYSGRFMYGQTCPGIVCDDPVAVGFAAAKSLDGYRELGAKCAALEKERDEFKVRIEGMYQVLLLFAREKEELTAKVGELQSARERDGSEAFPDERTLTREQVQESLRDAGIDMEKAQAKLKAVLKERKE